MLIYFSFSVSVFSFSTIKTREMQLKATQVFWNFPWGTCQTALQVCAFTSHRHIPQAPPMKILATCTCLPSIHIYYSVYHINYRQMRNWCKVTANCKHLCCRSNTRRSQIVRCWNTFYKAVFDFKENLWLQVHGATKGSICSRPMQWGRPMAKWVKQPQ